MQNDVEKLTKAARIQALSAKLLTLTIKEAQDRTEGLAAIEGCKAVLLTYPPSNEDFIAE